MVNPKVKYDLGGTCAPDEIQKRVNSQTLSVDVPCETLENIINNYAPANDGDFHFLNIDIEGFDEVAVSNISGWKSKPKVICIEILHADSINDVLQTKTNFYLQSAGYKLVGKTSSSVIYERV